MDLLPCLLLLLLFLDFCLSKEASPLTPLLSLKCNPSPPTHNITVQIQNLLGNLTLGAPATSLFTTSNITFGPNQYSGFMQCRPGFGPEQCSLCSNAARTRISTHCPNSNAISAWFDGCYVQISSNNSSQYTSISNHSCSAVTRNPNPALFVPALETLLLKLRADVNIPTRHGFSQGQIAYGAPNQTIYGLVECVRLISTRQCDYCVKNAVENLQIYCGGGNHDGGTVIRGACHVRFGSTNEIIYDGQTMDSSLGRVGTGDFTVGESGGNEHWCRKEAVVAYWGGGGVCFAVAVLLAGLLRRAVLNKAKVGVLECGETVGKS